MGTIMKYILVTIGIMFIIPFTVKADCSYEREAELSRIAANVQFSYTYEVNEYGIPRFNVNIINVSNDIYVRDNYGNNFYQNENNHTYQHGEELSFTIYSNDANCLNEYLLTQYVSLPKYNAFRSTKECQDNPDFKYCQMWSATASLTQQQFDVELQNYKQPNVDVAASQEKEHFWEGFKNGLLQNYYLIIILVVLIILIVVYKKRFGGKR